MRTSDNEKTGNTLPVADFEGDDFEGIMDRFCEKRGIDRAAEMAKNTEPQKEAA